MTSFENKPVLSRSHIVSSLHRGRTGPLYSSAKSLMVDTFFSLFCDTGYLEKTHFRGCGWRPVTEGGERGRRGHTTFARMQFPQRMFAVYHPQGFNSFLVLFWRAFPSVPVSFYTMNGAHVNSLNTSHCCRHTFKCLKIYFFFGTFMPLTTCFKSCSAGLTARTGLALCDT